VNTDRIPATIVTGFLGAGKTTLIRNLIARARGRRIAVIVNEFGDMGFDGELIADCGDSECRPDTIVELTNGCICCTVADEFLPTMEALIARVPAPDHIVIETSGLALPQPLVRAFSWPGVRHRVTVDSVVTVVDAESAAGGIVSASLARVAATPRHAIDEPVEELFHDQLVCADLVVVSKTDLVSEAQLGAVEQLVRRQARPGTAVVRGMRGDLSPDLLLGLSAAAETKMDGRESHHELEGAEHDHDDFLSVVVAPGSFASVEALRAGIAAVLALPGILRVKGRVAVAGKTAPAVVQAVGPRIETWFAPGSVASGLVVIGLRDMDQRAIAGLLAA
jgi:cobalamin biosynthesis protein CobW